jgi:hypothetical protein
MIPFMEGSPLNAEPAARAAFTRKKLRPNAMRTRLALDGRPLAHGAILERIEHLSHCPSDGRGRAGTRRAHLFCGRPYSRLQPRNVGSWYVRKTSLKTIESGLFTRKDISGTSPHRVPPADWAIDRSPNPLSIILSFRTDGREFPMSRFTLLQLSQRIPIVRDDIWVVYEGTTPVFQGSLPECRDWLDLNDPTPSRPATSHSPWRFLKAHF